MFQSMLLHAAHEHSILEEFLEGFSSSLPGGEATAHFLGHFVMDSLKIYLILFIVMFTVFFIQTYISLDRMRAKLAKLTSVWGYLLAIIMGMLSPFCSCSIVPILMGLISVGVPMPVCLCVLTSASLMNLTALTGLYGLAGSSYATLYLICSLAIIAVSSFILSKLHLNDCTQQYNLAHCHGHEHDMEEHQPQGRLALSLHSTWHVFKGAWVWILLGVALSSALGAYFPLDKISEIVSSNTVLSTIIAAVIGFPIHSDVFTISPILHILKDIYPPVSMTFTLSTMVISIPGIVLLSRVLKPKLIASYVAILIGLTLACGFILIPIM